MGGRGRALDDPPRTFKGMRAWQVGLRTVHVAAMGVVLGAVAFGVPAREVTAPIALTVLSGVALLGIDLWRSPAILLQGAGAATLVKLLLLGIGGVFPASRLGWFLAATAVASVGSHMPSGWRHYSLTRYGGRS